MRRGFVFAVLALFVVLGFAHHLASAGANVAAPAKEKVTSCADVGAPPEISGPGDDADARRHTCLCNVSYCIAYGKRCDWSSTCTTACGTPSKCDYSHDNCYCDETCIGDGPFPSPVPGNRCGSLPNNAPCDF